MKQYQSHKIVEAELIVSKSCNLDDDPEGRCYLLRSQDGTLYERFGSTESFPEGEFYLVTHGDCEWYEPKVVFENGYSEVE